MTFRKQPTFLITNINLVLFQAPAKRVVTGWLFFWRISIPCLLNWLATPCLFPGMVLASVILTFIIYHGFYLLIVGCQLRLILLFLLRILLITGLASPWVLIEWAKKSFSLGFPWCPLSVTQWERPAILQLVPYFGGWIVSFFLIFFNLCLLSYCITFW